MLLSAEALEILVLACAATILVLAALGVALVVRLRRLRAAYAAILDPAMLDPNGTADIFDAIARVRHDLADLRGDLITLGSEIEDVRAIVDDSVSQVGVVRYDAFEDMGGALSFSAALLDGNGDGVIFSAINGRTEGRTYAKPITDGRSEFNLSPEESEAIELALNGGKGTVVETPRRRWRRTAS
ncbi:MAG: DUF4446 family protein [Actinomycetota bacterium]|nr:DUF4446 family protein [Actinomycetota bacterium]